MFAAFGFFSQYEPMYRAFGFVDEKPALVGMVIVLQYIFSPYNAVSWYSIMPITFQAYAALILGAWLHPDMPE
jgi:hypothetical protein